MYRALKDSAMRNWEKLLNKRKKAKEQAAIKIEQADQADQAKQSLYTNPDGSIDWTRLAKHISEATRGR